MPKHKTTTNNDDINKQKRKAISLQSKYEIIKMHAEARGNLQQSFVSVYNAQRAR